MPKNTISIKIGLLMLLGLLMLIPLSMIENVILERASMQNTATRNISQRWGAQQKISTPILAVPYIEKKQIETLNAKTKERQTTIKKVFHWQYILANDVNITSSMTTEIRYLGIYEMPVYTVTNEITGDFDSQLIHKLATRNSDLQWQNAKLLLPINDVRGIRSLSKINIGGQQLYFSPASNTPFPGLMTALAFDYQQTKNIAFSYQLTLAGSRQLNYLPLARNTQYTLQSSWPSPNFNGAYLPAARKITEKGFSATWQVMEINRRFSQHWIDNQITPTTVNNSAFGIALYQPVDIYHKNLRTVKYGILFIVLTFTTFFIFEILLKLTLHPLQYMMVGAAISTFYLLLLSFSEHFSFAISYLVSAIALILLLSLYSSAILKQKKNGLIIGVMTSILYSCLFIILEAEDSALLFGSVMLFSIISILMYITRNIDWYQNTLESEKPDEI